MRQSDNETIPVQRRGRATRRVRLVNNWHRCLRWYSMHFIAAAGALQAAVLAFPEFMREWLPDYATHGVGLVILIGAVAGRLVDQEKRHVDDSH